MGGLQRTSRGSRSDTASVLSSLRACMAALPGRPGKGFEAILRTAGANETLEEAVFQLFPEEDAFDPETLLYMRHLAGIEGGITLRELAIEGSIPSRTRR